MSGPAHRGKSVEGKAMPCVITCAFLSDALSWFVCACSCVCVCVCLCVCVCVYVCVCVNVFDH